MNAQQFDEFLQKVKAGSRPVVTELLTKSEWKEFRKATKENKQSRRDYIAYVKRRRL